MRKLKKAEIKRIRKGLLDWYDLEARDLPWRRDPSPYGTWISEMMLQQTRVDTVIPYYRSFIEALPSVEALAEVEEDFLLKLWQGLGYYSRARNLHKAAQVMMKEFGGNLPRDPEVLKTLPGIGEYSKGSIASIAYGVPVPAVDGNVIRVLTRMVACSEDWRKSTVKDELFALASSLVPEDRPGDFNQGLMELGALVCLPKGEPLCESCPLGFCCQAFLLKRTDAIPFKPPKKEKRIEEKTVLLLMMKEKVAISKRSSEGLLGGMYEFPSLPGQLSLEESVAHVESWGFVVEKGFPLESAHHVFSHIRWEMLGYRLKLRPGFEQGSKELPESLGSLIFVSKEELREVYSVPRAFRSFLADLQI